MIKRLATMGVVACLAGPVHACELARPVVFAGLDWDSVGFHNAVARFVVEHGYGCRTDVIPGSTIPLIQGVAQGDIDVAMEIWKDAVTDAWQRALARGQVVELGVNFPDAVQGWVVPRAVIDGDPARGRAPAAPDLKSVADLARYAHVFADPEEPGKGRFYNCVAGWACEGINTHKLRAYGLSDRFTNFRTGSGAALAAAISGAVRRGEPIVAYYWSPTWVMGAHDLVMLAEPPWNAADWQGIAASADYPRPVAYPKVEVWIGANAAFAKSAPALTAFLKNYRTTAAQVSAALAFMHDTGTDETAAARRFLTETVDTWPQWLPSDAAAKVKAALAAPN
ncbi:MAG: ABC transporter substrate-binding protein [Rhodospirillaceae bacterium]|nr:ABC transporter substrate-binding protein [Rhodospirillaceae bacterium]